MEDYRSGDFPDDDRSRRRKRKQIIAGFSFLIILVLLMPLATLLWAPLLKPLARSVLVRLLNVLRFIAMTSAISAGIITTSHHKPSDEHSSSKGTSQHSRSRSHQHKSSDGRDHLSGKGKNAVIEDLGKDHGSSYGSNSEDSRKDHRASSEDLVKDYGSSHGAKSVHSHDWSVEETVKTGESQPNIRHRRINYRQQGDFDSHLEGSSSRLGGDNLQQIHEDSADSYLVDDHGKGEFEEVGSLRKLGSGVGPSRIITNEEGPSRIITSGEVGSDNPVSSTTNIVDEGQSGRANPSPSSGTFPSVSKLKYRAKHSSSDANLDQLVHNAARKSTESKASSSTSSRRRRPTSLSYDFDSDYARALRLLAPPPETILGPLSARNINNNCSTEGSTINQRTQPLIDLETLAPWRISPQPVDHMGRTTFSRDDLSPSAGEEAANLELEKRMEEFIARTHEQWVKQKQASLERRRALLEGRNGDSNMESKGKSHQ